MKFTNKSIYFMSSITQQGMTNVEISSVVLAIQPIRGSGAGVADGKQIYFIFVPFLIPKKLFLGPLPPNPKSWIHACNPNVSCANYGVKV